MNSHRFCSLCALAALSTAVAGSCAAGSSTSRADGGAGGAGGWSSSTTGTGAEVSFVDSGTSSSSSSSGAVDPDAGCAGTATKAQQLPLGMYIMLDRSQSMDETVSGTTKWEAVTDALKTFVQQPLTGVSVGIQYFAVPPSQQVSCPSWCAGDVDCNGYGPCTPGVGCFACFQGFAEDSCDAVDYATPDVEIAPLPGVAQAIFASINGQQPGTNTPTSAALAGAIQHGQAWAASHPDHVVIAVLATDGEPSECDTNLASINAVAAAGANGDPPILTFVIGVGALAQALNGIAAAGGTSSAFIVATNQDVNQQFIAALDKIRGKALGCQYKIPLPPAPEVPDFGKVNVQYTPGDGGPVQVFANVEDSAHCPSGGDGWYYDDNAFPKTILLCPQTCNKVSVDGAGRIDVVLGCATVVE